MKGLKSLSAIVAIAVAGACMTSCDSDESTSQTVVSISSPSLSFNEDGYWSQCYEPQYDNSLTFDGVNFSHSALVTEWDGVKYYSWKGFCPSVSRDNSSHPENWIDYQWGSIAGGSVVPGDAYMLGCWDVNESTDAIPQAPSCVITSETGAITPVEVYVTNTAYGYYVMRDGNDFCRKFTDSDLCRLYIHGVRDGKLTGTVTVDLAKGTDILDSWKPVSLQQLGSVDKIYFQMTSTDSGQWGMNTPAYFCIDRLRIDRE